MQTKQLLLMCRSLTYAQRTAKALERKGITGVVTRAPKSASPNGCGYCVIVSPRRGKQAVRILRDAGLEPVRMMLRSEDGSLREADDDLS